MKERDASQELTETIYDFICSYIAAHGFAPSQREIAAHCYLSKTGVLRHLDRLEMKGRITREEGRARSIHVVKIDDPEK